MTKKPDSSSKTKRSKDSAPVVSGIAAVPDEQAFAEILGMIQSARARVNRAANNELIGLYWRVGEYISRKLETAAWGEGVVDALALYIQQRHPNLQDFTLRNLFRMRQFFDAYKEGAKVSALLAQLPWTHHLMIVSRCKRPDTNIRQGSQKLLTATSLGYS